MDYLYLDESGDLGFEKGASDHFIVTIIAIDDARKLEKIVKKKIKISLATPNGIRADRVNLNLLKLFKKAGGYFVAFGIESGSQEILNNIAKHSNLDFIRKAVRIAHQADLITQGFFIFGLPGETKKTIQETIDFAKKLPLDKAQFLMLDVLPGSQLWKELNFGQKVNWNLDSFHEISWQPPGLDQPTLVSAQSRAFRSFFLRPKQLWTLVRLVKLNQLRYILRRIRDFSIVKV